MLISDGVFLITCSLVDSHLGFDSMKLYIDIVSARISVFIGPLEHTSFEMRGLISKYYLKVLNSISVVIMHQILTGRQVNNCRKFFALVAA